MVFEKQGLLTGKGLLVKGLSATWQGLILQENQSTSIQLSVPLSASGKYIKLNAAKSFFKQVETKVGWRCQGVPWRCKRKRRERREERDEPAGASVM